MTEAEWLTCEKPAQMFLSLGVNYTARKWRLVCCGFCRRTWDLLISDVSRQAIEAAEQFADGELSEDGLASARIKAALVFDSIDQDRSVPLEVRHAAAGAEGAVMPDPAWMPWPWGKGEVSKWRSDLVRDVFGNPHRPGVFHLGWRTDTVLSLATRMYASHDFSAMPILADALQDVGCGSEDILNHCRDTSVMHVRGCWAVDLMLGKK